eukprot:1155124-Pelagomonas_calceolata.AAC.2
MRAIQKWQGLAVWSSKACTRQQRCRRGGCCLRASRRAHQISCRANFKQASSSGAARPRPAAACHGRYRHRHCVGDARPLLFHVA